MIDPVALQIGPLAIRWYALAYIAGIVIGWRIARRLCEALPRAATKEQMDDYVTWATLGIILGGRLGYATFYTGGDTGIPSLWAHPGELLQLWNGGMSFHGGLVGTVLAIAWVSWRGGLPFLRVADYIAVCVPFGMFFGRLANFVNGELWGRVAGPDVPWAMVFPGAGPLERHPSQLYEAVLEGLVLIVVMLWLFWKTRARWRPGLLVGVFTAGIALGRFVVEFFREPDAQLAAFAASTGLSMGQWLTLPLLATGLFFAARALLRPPLGSGTRGPA